MIEGYDSIRETKTDIESVDIPPLFLTGSRAAAGVRAQSFDQPMVAATRLKRKQKNVFHDSAADLLALEKQAAQVDKMQYFIQQVTAVLLVTLLNLMCAIPFGVSYFPVEWGDSTGTDGGDFPIQGKEALGIRMFLFSTVIGQMVFTLASGFRNGVGLQMVENVPFCHALAYICINEQGYGIETLSTLFFLFGFASFLVGLTFFFLGYFNCGRIVYFFPSHVLIGCIGGIGYFVATVALEVTMNADFSLTPAGIRLCIKNFHLIGVVLLFEFTLRILTKITTVNGKPKYPLLSPIFYCAITPIFYLFLFIFRISMEEAQANGYFFPSVDGVSNVTAEVGTNYTPNSIFASDIFDIWTVINFSTISWSAVIKSIPTLVSLTTFSLIHVPINIPAFSISSGVDCDMNVELKAHGYSNALAGMFGGLQNYLCYANSVLYDQSNGEGRWSGVAIAILTAVLFFAGPSIAAYIPRCMAGTLLLHIGIDLLIEGVYDSYGEYDTLEYSGIWLITVVMSIWGMSAALVAGVIAALSVFAAQSMTHQNPVRGAMSAKTLRSSRWNRPPGARAILDDDTVGRKKIFMIQLQGHIFFGNVVSLTESIKGMLKEKKDNVDDAWIVILDFTLVNGIDSSAAQSISKLKAVMHQKFNVSLAIFVTGSTDGFPCCYDLSHDITANSSTLIAASSHEDSYHESKETSYLLHPSASSNLEGDDHAMKMQQVRIPSSVTEMGRSYMPKIPADKICVDLDEALIFAEDALIGLQDHTLLSHDQENDRFHCIHMKGQSQENWTMSSQEEEDMTYRYMSSLCHGETDIVVKKLLSLFKRNIWKKNQILWKQSSQSKSLHLVVNGLFLSELEEEAGTTEVVHPGAIFGELGLISGVDRLSTVRVLSNEAITMTLERDVWERDVKSDIDLSRCLYMISINYMSHRLQHVSNRIFETRCLPI